MVCNMVQQKEDGLMAECRKKNGDGFMAEYRKKKEKRRISSVEEREELLLTVDRTEGTVAVCESGAGSGSHRRTEKTDAGAAAEIAEETEGGRSQPLMVGCVIGR